MLKIEINPYKRITIKQLYSIIIALLPVISFYRVPFLGFGMATFFAGITIPYVLYVLLNGEKVPVIVFSLAVWMLYFIVRSYDSFQTVFLLIVVLLHVWGALKGSTDIQCFRKTIEIISVAMTFFVLLQTVVYYTAHIKLMFLIKDFVLPDNQYYVTRVTTGLYRPSALFLEPSHYTQYVCFGMLSALFPYDNKPKMLKAFWIAFGCLLTTSGMGIALCCCVFGWYLLFNKNPKERKIITIFIWLLTGLVVFAVLMQIGMFKSAVQRIFGKVDGYNAIWGRTLFWDSYIGSLSGKELLIGRGVNNLPEGYMTGLMSIIYQYGYVGLGLLLCLLLAIAIWGKDNYSICCSIIYAGLLFIANNTGFLSFIFYFVMIASSAWHKVNAVQRKEQTLDGRYSTMPV